MDRHLDLRLLRRNLPGEEGFSQGQSHMMSRDGSFNAIKASHLLSSVYEMKAVSLGQTLLTILSTLRFLYILLLRLWKVVCGLCCNRATNAKKVK